MSSATGGAVVDLDVLEHLLREAELAGQHEHDIVVVLRFEDRLDDLLAPLDRAVGRGARARALELGADRQQVGAVLALGERGQGGRVRVGDDQQVERLDALGRLRHPGHGVAAVAEHDHRLDVVALRNLILRQQGGVEPAGRRDARRLHHLLDRRSASAPSRSRPPRPAPSAATHPRPGRSRAAACRHRGPGRWRPARCSGRGRCWRRRRSPPTLPVASSEMQKARTLAVPTVCWVAPMHQISVAGFSFANISATRCEAARPERR